jgi:quinol monooxygenase YgiN
MAKLTIVASITANGGQMERVKGELLKLVEKTNAEDEGCILYTLHQDNENPAQFVVFENWESKELLQTHLDSVHFKACMAALDGALVAFSVKEMTRIG